MVRSYAVAVAAAVVGTACATTTTSSRASLVRELHDAERGTTLPDYGPLDDHVARVDAAVDAVAGSMTVGGWHGATGGISGGIGVRDDALVVRVEGAALSATRISPDPRHATPLGDGDGVRAERVGVIARYSLYAAKVGACTWCGKHSPPTRLERLDLWVEGGAGYGWYADGGAGVSRPEAELGVGFDVGPRRPGDHWAIELGVDMIVAASPDGPSIDHPVLAHMGVAFGS